MRITKEYNKLINDNVYWSTEDFHKDFFDDKEESQLLKDDTEKGERLGDDLAPDKDVSLANSEADKSIDFARMKALDDILNDKKFIEMVEDIAMSLLRPSLPVISLMKLKNAVREAILERKDSFL